MQSPNESDGSEEYFDAEDSTPHRLVKYVRKEICGRIVMHAHLYIWLKLTAFVFQFV